MKDFQMSLSLILGLWGVTEYSLRWISKLNESDESQLCVNVVAPLQRHVMIFGDEFLSRYSVDSNKTFSGQNVVKSGGSVLDVMEDIIRVGQVMGYSMEGCVKDLENIIGKQGEDNVIR
ncbi:hypothetical protein Tco_1482754 [Tanacetum coccineum]